MDDIHTHGGTSLLRKIDVFFLNASFRLLLNYRVGAYLREKSDVLSLALAHYLRYKQITKRNCQLSYEAVLGHGIKFPHPIGIVIGGGVVVKDNVRIWQHVTLGSHGKKAEGKGYPTVEEGVRIFANAIVVGEVNVGRNATVAAGAVVLRDVPARAVAVGSPARVRG